MRVLGGPRLRRSPPATGRCWPTAPRLDYDRVGPPIGRRLADLQLERRAIHLRRSVRDLARGVHSEPRPLSHRASAGLVPRHAPTLSGGRTPRIRRTSGRIRKRRYALPQPGSRSATKSPWARSTDDSTADVSSSASVLCGIGAHRTALRCTSFHRFGAAAVFYPIFYPRRLPS
jgi:hypothetical protein